MNPIVPELWQTSSDLYSAPLATSAPKNIYGRKRKERSAEFIPPEATKSLPHQ
jgi:hypothetical protein